MARVRALLAESRAAVREGRALFDRAVGLRGEAFVALPVGTRLRYDLDLLEYVVERCPDGWQQVGGDGRPDAKWVLEQWDRRNWRVVGEDDLG